MKMERGICRSDRRRRRRACKEICLTKLASNSISIQITTTWTTLLVLALGLLLGLARATNSADPRESPRPTSPAGELPALVRQDAHRERQHTNSMASRHYQPPGQGRGQKVKIGLSGPTGGQMINELAGVTLTRRPTRLTRSSPVGRDNNNNNSEVDLDEETISWARGEPAAAAASRLSISNKVNAETNSTSERELASAQWTSSGNNNNSPLLPPAWLLKCRVEKDLYLDFDEYQHYTCANCYNQVPPEFFKEKLDFVRLDERTVRLLAPERSTASGGGDDAAAEMFVWANDTVRIRQTFNDLEKYQKWELCCRQAVDCCIANSQHLTLGLSRQRRKVAATGGGAAHYELVDNPGRSECPGTWDGMTCWPASPAGKAWQECPKVAYLLDFEPACRGYVTKQCYPNASWFINRYGHEWSDYSTCSPEGLYKKRMLIAAVAYICEALIVLPALLILGKFPNRGGNKRIRIMKHLLFYILLNSLIQFLERSFLAAGYFAEYRSGPMGLEQLAPPPPPPSPLDPPYTIPLRPDKLALISSALSSSSSSPLMAAVGPIGARHARSIGSRVPAARDDLDDDELVARIFLTGGRPGDDVPAATDESGDRDDDEFIARRRASHTKLNGGRQQLAVPAASFSAHSGRAARLSKRHADISAAQSAVKRDSSLWKALACWLLQLAGRLVRLMSYAWMFTGGVYLCSALHCAPAEPPAKFIKVLFFLTHAFPTTIFLAYVTARTLNEPSPLNILIKVPYFWLTGEPVQVDHLYASQQVCWFGESGSQHIEDIADLPNMILVGLNVVLFVFTLIILCRMNRPGSTRTDMSPCAYFRAAGTLLFLYGGHYFFLAYRPANRQRHCGLDIFIFYAFIAIDGVQGIAISFVFCYMTQEGKAVISKYWRNRNRYTPFRQCAWLSCSGDKSKLADNGYHHTPRNGNGHHNSNSQNSDGHHYHHQGKSSSLNHSTRSNTSVCNGHDTVTELVNLNDTQICTAEQF